MKRILMVLFVLFLSGSLSHADDIDEYLGQSASREIRNSARETIQLGLSSEDLLTLTKTMLQKRFRERTIVETHRILASAHRKDLPPGPIMSKAYEGIAKQVREEHVTSAMKAVEARYTFAYRQAAQMTQDRSHVRNLGDTISDCLAAGMHERTISRLMEQIRTRTRSMDVRSAQALTLETLAMSRVMAQHGVSSNTTAKAVIASLQKGYSAREMAQMRNSFMRQAKTASPEGLGRAYAEQITQGKSSGNLNSPAGSGTGFESGGLEGTGGSGHGGGRK